MVMGDESGSHKCSQSGRMRLTKVKARMINDLMQYGFQKRDSTNDQYPDAAMGDESDNNNDPSPEVVKGEKSNGTNDRCPDVAMGDGRLHK